MSELLTHEQIIAAAEQPDVATKPVNVPELGGKVLVREMSAAVRNRFEATAATIRSGGDSRALDTVTAQIVAACVVDERGRPMLTVNEVKRIAASKPKAVFRLREAIVKISATDEEDLEDLEEVFVEGPNGPSTSD
ncbi:hypothetical protein OHR68_43175 [Spirillospora sp. NBC_00431]